MDDRDRLQRTENVKGAFNLSPVKTYIEKTVFQIQHEQRMQELEKQATIEKEKMILEQQILERKFMLRREEWTFGVSLLILLLLGAGCLWTLL